MQAGMTFICVMDFKWTVGRYTIAQLAIGKLTIEPGSNVHVQSFVTATSLIAPGTVEQPITVSSSNDCFGSLGGCGITITDSASSRKSNIQHVNARLTFAK
jgi:hypothetical protein